MYPSFLLLSSMTGEFKGEEELLLIENQWPNKNVVEYLIPNVQTKFIRLIPQESHPWAQLSEFEVYVNTSLITPTPISSEIKNWITY